MHISYNQKWGELYSELPKLYLLAVSPFAAAAHFRHMHTHIHIHTHICDLLCALCMESAILIKHKYVVSYIFAGKP